MRLVLGGLVWGDAISMVMRSRWWCEIYGDAGAEVLAALVLGCDRVDR